MAALCSTLLNVWADGILVVTEYRIHPEDNVRVAQIVDIPLNTKVVLIVCGCCCAINKSETCIILFLL